MRGLPQSIQNQPEFDYGASGSLRHFISSANYLPFFRKLDHDMYLKTAERQLLESMIAFLTTKNIDTSDIKERMAVILNNDVARVKGRSQLLNNNN
jgi:hypothetical protein